MVQQERSAEKLQIMAERPDRNDPKIHSKNLVKRKSACYHPELEETVKTYCVEYYV